MTETVVAGYKVTDTRGLYGMSVPDYEKTVQAAHKARLNLLEKEVAFTQLQNKTVEDIRNMSMAEYAALSRKMNYGVSTNVGGPPVFGTEYRPGAMTPYDKWEEARERFIKGEITDIEIVLRYVRDEDSDRYTALVDFEIAQERAEKEVANSGLRKHRFRWCRWPSWRWLASWLHR